MVDICRKTPEDTQWESIMVPQKGHVVLTPKSCHISFEIKLKTFIKNDGPVKDPRTVQESHVSLMTSFRARKKCIETSVPKF